MIDSGAKVRPRTCVSLASSAIAADGSILRPVIGRRSRRQWRAVTRFMRAEFRGNLAEHGRRQHTHVDGLIRFDFELLRLLVAHAVEHRLGDANRQGPMLRVRLVGFQHTLEHMDRGMLERQERSKRILLPARSN
jgi:hypothetical protein